DPTKVRIGERDVREGEVSLLELMKGRVVSLTSANDQGNVNVQDASNDNLNEEGDDVAGVDQAEQGGQVVYVRRIDIVANDEIHAIVVEQPKRVRKKWKTADGASGSGLPPKKLKEDHGISGDVGTVTAGKYLVVLQGLLDSSTLATEVGVMAADTVLFVTSFVTPTPGHEGGGHTNSITSPNLRTQKLAERFLISFGSLYEPNAHADDDEVTSVVRSFVLDPAILTMAVATTVVADTSALVPRNGHGSGVGQARSNIFRDFVFPSIFEVKVAGPSQPVSTELLTGSFYVSHDMDSDALRFFSQLRGIDYEQLLAEFNVEVARQVYFNAKTRMRLEHELRGRRRFEERCALQANRNVALEGRVAALESAAASKDAELASSNSQVRVLSDRVAGIDSDLIEMALHMDEEFYPRRAIDKGMQDGLAAAIDHGKVGMSLFDVFAYNPSTEANYVGAITALHPTAEALEASHLQPSPEQLMVLIHRLKDQVVIRETSMAFSLDVAHTRIQRIRGDVAARRLSLTDSMVPLIEPLSVKSLTGEANSYRISAMAVTIALSTTLAQASTVPLAPSTEVPPSKIVFEQEELDTTLEHSSAM
nr:hypothetical protein [Tanacetum cinerariifolium]